jgi:hypothetical protein
VLERQLDVGLQEAFLAAAVVAAPLVAVGEHLLVLEQAGDAVGELDLAADAARLGGDLVEHARRQHVAAGDAEARRRDLGRGLLDDPVDLDQPLADGAPADDP